MLIAQIYYFSLMLASLRVLCVLICRATLAQLSRAACRSRDAGVLCVLHLTPMTRLIPRITQSNWKFESRGLGSPHSRWSILIMFIYCLTKENLSERASKAAYLHKMSEVAGTRGNPTAQQRPSTIFYVCGKPFELKRCKFDSKIAKLLCLAIIKYWNDCASTLTLKYTAFVGRGVK